MVLFWGKLIIHLFSWDMSLVWCGVSGKGWWGLLTVSCSWKHRPGQCLVMWDDRLPCWCWPFFEARERQDWKDSLHPLLTWNICRDTLLRGGRFHKKFCWHLQMSTSVMQQTSAKSFSLDSFPVSSVLSSLFGSSFSYFFLLCLSLPKPNSNIKKNQKHIFIFP